MDLDIVQNCVADRVGDLRALDQLDAGQHIFAVLLGAQIRREVDDRGDPLRDGRGRDHDGLAVLRELRGLSGGHHDVLVVGQDIDRIRIDLFHGVQDVVRAGIHGLTAFDHAVHAQAAEDLRDPVADSDRDKGDLLVGHLSLGLSGLRLSGCLLLRGRLGGSGLLQLPVFDDQLPELTVLEALLDGQSRIIGLQLHADLAVLLLTDYGLSDRLQIFDQAPGRGLVEVLVGHDPEGGAVEMLEDGLLHHLLSRRLGGLCLDRSDLPAQKTVVAALQKLDQALAAAVDDAGLLENRQHIGGFGEDLLAVADHLGDKDVKILLALVRELVCLVGNSLGHGQDGSLLGLHDRLVGRLHGPAEGLCHNGDRDLLAVPGHLAESAQKLGQDDAGISPRAPQGPGRDRLADIPHGPRVFIQVLKLSDRRLDGQRHIGAGISVRNGKDIQLIDPFLSGLETGSPGKEKIDKAHCVN